jgi:dTDP-glucose 4,6-dehydratase
MRIVVTGAAGFVGSHICERALERGWTVTGIDNCITGTPENVAHLMSHERFIFIEADVSAGVPDVPGADALLHFASPASPKDYAERPLETLRVNSRGTEACCEFAVRRGARLLFASTSEIYGDPLEHPQRETYWGNVNSIGERSCYDEGKRYGEAVVSAYRRVQALDGRIVRIFNTYGPRMRINDGRVVPNFVRQALSGEPLTIYGDGEQTRSLCYVDD